MKKAKPLDILGKMLTAANISDTFKHIKLIQRISGNIRVVRTSTNLVQIRAFSVKSSANSIYCAIIERYYYDVIKSHRCHEQTVTVIIVFDGYKPKHVVW